ncbi:alanine racemase [Patella vulgata]|uniref:alanine racemase n=1 Tax=Patella vulgata TaxID=6465 RepID=UPI0024A8F99C|nr:alanine racemase [Patella vulgata]
MDGIQKEFELAGRSSYLRIDLDTILHNINTLREFCSKTTDVIAVIKANAYGHGSLEIARYLEANGISHFAVATAWEGAQLRQYGVTGYIQILGSCIKEDIYTTCKFNLTPTICTAEFLQAWSDWYLNQNKSTGSVVIKFDTGMGRNGCQQTELNSLIQKCDDLKIPVHSVMTHFSQAWDDPKFTQQQLDTFLTATKDLRCRGIKLHAANSAAIIQGYGTDLDFVRPGICMYGLPPDPSKATVEKIKSLNLKPALSWLAKPTLVKLLPPGSYVGYDKTYQCKEEEIIGTFSIGYADGYRRLLSSGGGYLTSIDGKRFPIIGRVSMDAITVKLDNLDSQKVYYVMKNDYTSGHSLTKLADELKTIPYEIATSLGQRLPRLYVSDEKLTVTM